MRKAGHALRMLAAPRLAAPAAAQAPLWFPLVLLGVTTALAEYPPISRYGLAQFAQMRLDATPNGMYRSSLAFFLWLTCAAPFLLSLGAWLAGRFMDVYIRYALDVEVSRAHVVRVTAYGLLPLAIEHLLVGVLKLGCGEDCNLFNPLAANVAFFLNVKTTPVFWYELARGADLFSCWTALVLCLGLAGIAELRPSQLVFPVVFTWAGAAVVNAWLLG